MTINEYQKEAMRTAKGMDYSEYSMLVNSALGVCGETAEAVEGSIAMAQQQAVEGLIASEYQQAAERTALEKCYDMVNIALGLCIHTGRIADAVKKHIFHGHELDKDYLIKEYGDTSWYIAVGAKSIDTDYETILKENIKKLWERYPDGFTTERSINRGNKRGQKMP